MKKILFVIHDLGQGGAEKVLVNLVNNINKTKFDVTVLSLFGGGVNEQFLDNSVDYKTVFPRMIPGNSKLMKLFSAKTLHEFCVKDKYDIEISYLEGPAARVVSGCPDPKTKLVSWIHVEQHSREKASEAFRSYNEALSCYNKFDQIVCVSEYVKADFTNIFSIKQPCCVLYNTVDSEEILKKSHETDNRIIMDGNTRMIAVGTLKVSKGYDSMFRVVKRLIDLKYSIHLYVLGIGPEQHKLEQFIKKNSLENNITLLGYDTNPYKYVKKCDLFICTSHAEGFSTATTESLILGTPVCTVDVSGMKEMLGYSNEYGVVTENNEEAFFQGIKSLLDSPERLLEYKQLATERGKRFSTSDTVKAVEEMLKAL